jgi:N-glycosylase/DNA lyase
MINFQVSPIKVDNSHNIDSIDDLRAYYLKIKPFIEQRLAEFEQIKSAEPFILFRELAFCILTANASAKMSINAINRLDRMIMTASEKEIMVKLQGIYRFPVVRAKYIVKSREFLHENCQLDLHILFNRFDDKFALRDYLKENILGIGCKESSHFLRNVGFKGFAILDKHVISMLNQMRCVVRKPKSKKEYKEIEQKMVSFAKHIDIDMDHLDLLFWSYKSGEIFK